MADFDFANHGSVCLLTPRTEAAHDWVNFIDEPQWFGSSIAIEPRYAPSIITAIIEDGLTVQ
jgi:hypothetical protein